MPRLARLVVPGLPHHVTQRGCRRQTVFFSHDDYRTYLGLLARNCAEAGTAIWAWCLMPNHVHLILVPEKPDGLRRALAATHRRYACAVNRREDWQGHLWQERFASFPMDESYLLACARYVELNPVRAGLVGRPEQWMWSSARDHLGFGADGLTETRALLGRWPDWRTILDGGLDPAAIEAIRARELDGHPLGDAGFLARLAALTSRPLASRRRGRPRKAER
ncbi:MAG TPA: transposase [Allosphingosinicella sp.]|nr:transposase [Allosphingosinicella sp.]